MTYTSKLIKDNMYEINTINNGEPITFNVIIAKDISELDGLVEFHLNYLNNPSPVYSTVNTTSVTIQSLQTQLNNIQAQIAALTPASTTTTSTTISTSSTTGS